MTREVSLSSPSRGEEGGLAGEGEPFPTWRGAPLTTAMGIMPHRDPDRALELAFSLDIPFWPQLPNISFSEDTYVQTISGMPGIRVDHREKRITLDDDAFYSGLEEYLEHDAESDIFSMRPDESATYGGFLKRASGDYPALRGQFMGPISMCLMVKDADKKPVIYRDDVREVVISHVARRVNRHLRDLRSINPRSFVWVDEPGLEFLFTGITGYTSERARGDLDLFLSLLDGPRGIHLCGNPDWDFLLQAEVELLSLDAYNNRDILAGYGPGLRKLLEKGGTIAWGIVPTHTEVLEGESAAGLAARLTDLWEKVGAGELGLESIAGHSLITPATCCLVNPDFTATVERAFALTGEVAGLVKPRAGGVTYR